eukprot:518952-Amphidinium_carterae.1
MDLMYAPKADVQDDGPGVEESTARSTKGQKGLKSLRMTTPIVALAFSVSGYRWWQTWLEVRSILGVEASPCLPQANKQSFINRPMSSTRATT